MMEEEGTIDFDGLTPKELTKLYKTVVKEVKNKDIDEKLKALLVDSWYDSYLGVVILVRVINGKIKKKIK